MKKYLGVILDEVLRSMKAIGVFWQCRKALGKSWGLKGNNVDLHCGDNTNIILYDLSECSKGYSFKDLLLLWWILNKHS